MPRRTRPLQERMWEKVQQSADGCWQWTGALSLGYGVLGAGRRGTGVLYAHRVMYEEMRGPIPLELQIDHLCRNRACVNPTHLEPVTQVENIRRGAGFTAVNGRKTHCAHGHEFTDANTYYHPNGGRRCRKCIRRHTAEQNQRRRKS